MDWLGLISRELMPVIGLGILLLFLRNDTKLDHEGKRWFYYAVVLELSDILIYEYEIWSATLGYPTVFHTLSVVAGYILRPAIVIAIIFLAVGRPRDAKEKAYIWAPFFLNAVVSLIGFFSGAAFYYDDGNAFQKGPIGYMIYIISAYYLLLLLFLNVKHAKGHTGTEKIIIFADVAFLMAAMYVQYESGDQSWVLRTAMAASTLFYFFLLQNKVLFSLIDNVRLHEEELSIVVTQSGKNMMLYDLTTRILVNQTASNAESDALVVYEDVPDSVIKSGMILPDSREAFRAFFENMHQEIPHGSDDFHITKPDGSPAWAHGDYTLQTDKRGRFIRSIVSFSEVTEQMEQKLRHEQRISEIITLTHDCDFYIEGTVDRWTIDNIHVVADEAQPALHAMGRSIDDALEYHWRPLIYPEDYDAVKEFLNKNRLLVLNANGISSDKIEFRLSAEGRVDWRSIELCLISASKAEELGFFVIFRDINDARVQHEQLVNRATIDKLTGLLNREATMLAIEKFISGEGASGTHALLMLDFDNLKKLNDTMGHQAGDDALRRFGQTMKNSCRRDDIVGRVGGDEFFILLKDVNADTVASKTKELITNLQVTFSNANGQVVTSASVGIAMYNGNSASVKSLPDLYAEADMALYKSKSRGKNTYTFADETDALAAASSTALLKNETISYNLRGLLNNLANGIAIYHGKFGEAFVPTFCNERLLELIGKTNEEFFENRIDNSCFFAHPEDRERVYEALEDAVKTKKSIQITYRMRIGAQEYRWVSVFANAHLLDDGSHDLYVIFSDAEDAMRNRQEQENRYNLFMEKEKLLLTDRTVNIHVNLTTGACSSLNVPVSGMYPVDTSKLDAFLASVARNIKTERSKAEFLEKFSADALQASFAKGILTVEISVPFAHKTGSTAWCYLIADITRNPVTEEVEAIMSMVKADREIRVKALMEKVMNTDYEAIGELDPQTGLLTAIIGQNPNNVSPNAVIVYMEKLEETMRGLVAPDYIGDAVRAMSLVRVINELERNKTYTVTMPAKTDAFGYNGVYQWRFSYVDEDKQSILILRGGMIALAGTRRKTALARAAVDQLTVKKNNKILIADDDADIRAFLQAVFDKEYEVIEAVDGEEAIRLIDENHDELALIFLDTIMPKKSGLDVLVHINMRGLADTVPVIMITEDDTPEKRMTYYDYRVADLLAKPMNGEVVRKRAIAIIGHFERANASVAQLKERTDEVALMQYKADMTNELLINALSSVVEFRNLESGLHVERVRKLSEIMLKAWGKVKPDAGFSEEDIRLMSKAAALHDIGKVAIPDEILLKPGRLTPEEYAVIKKHPIIGCEILEHFKQDDNDFYRYCYDICRYHHERYDGNGYPDKLSGEDIPVWAQVVSIVDVFDALVSKRVYKDAYPVDKAIAMIENGECGVFSPRLLRCFRLARKDIIFVAKQLEEEERRNVANADADLLY